MIWSDNHFDFSSFASSLDALVTMLVEILEVASQFHFFRVVLIGGELFRKSCKSLLVEFVHVCFEISELRENLTTMAVFGALAAIQFAFVFSLPRAWIGGSPLAVGSLSNMSSFMSAKIA